uniref:protein-tyrosine-phosphatase n=1 Tax=Timema monikensis TaxID=170555 RepID=A0A7R9HLU7_9NEOP|nr:unnamed protein product [Timema monikensis]
MLGLYADQGYLSFFLYYSLLYYTLVPRSVKDKFDVSYVEGVDRRKGVDILSGGRKASWSVTSVGGLGLGSAVIPSFPTSPPYNSHMFLAAELSGSSTLCQCGRSHRSVRLRLLSLVHVMIWGGLTAECCEVCHSCSSQGFQKSRSLQRRINLPLNYGNSPYSNKENAGGGVSPVDTETLPFGSPNKIRQNKSPSKFAMFRQLQSPVRPRHPLEDHDPNSQDSGYGASFPDSDEIKSGFQFVEPLGMAPRRSAVEQSPRKGNTQSPKNKSPTVRETLFRNLSSGSDSCHSIDDGFPEIFDIDKMDEDTQLPTGLSSLLSGPIIKDHNGVTPGEEKTAVRPAEESRKKLPLRRSLSMVENISPAVNKARSCLFSPTATVQSSTPMPVSALRSFKRPEPPCDNLERFQTKRRKSSSLHVISENILNSKSPPFQRSFSENEATIKNALQRSTIQPDLIGDFSKPFFLPLIPGRHQDLKTITPETLAALMNGGFADEVESYSIIDCRYPYEFEGGHIRGAKNIYTKEQILKELVENKNLIESSSDSSKRNIVVFHCEFSSERGPNLSRFLRNMDRGQNEERYPALHYPELYLLHGGYKDFYEQFNTLCEPSSYRPMLDPDHETDLRHFRAKSKSWSGDGRSRMAMRNSLKRLGL